MKVILTSIQQILRKVQQKVVNQKEEKKIKINNDKF